MATLTVYAGVMNSGKTEKLLLALKDLDHAVLLLGWAVADRNRDDPTTATSRSGISMPCTYVDTPYLMPMLETANTFQTVGIEDAQFFGDLQEFVFTLIECGVDVQMSTLLEDYKGDDWPNRVDKVFRRATHPYRLMGECEWCHEQTSVRNPRRTESAELVVVGGSDEYLSVCMNCVPFEEFDEVLDE